VKAKVGPPAAGAPKSKFTVHYFDESGNLTIRSEGTRAWRMNNPGNLEKSRYSTSKDRRCIGTAGDGVDEYAVYPDYATGHEALIVMLRGSQYSPLTLRQASSKYAPKDPNHISNVISKTKLDPERTIRSLSDEEFRVYWTALEEIEKWIPGLEEFFERWYITGVHKKRKVIFEYLVHRSDRPIWISKAEAITLTEENRLHAIVVHLKNGASYLRPESGSGAFVQIT
jgi:hypothetical protein